jgi:hypothetical protein
MSSRARITVVVAMTASGCAALLGLDEPTFDAAVEAGTRDACAVDLTSDPAHCGRCGHDCRGAPCTGGLCTPSRLSEGEGYVFQLRADETHLYFLSFDRWMLTRIDKDGGSRIELLPEGGLQEPTGLALDPTHAYYTAYGAGNTIPSRHGVRRVPKGGGTPETFETCNTAYGLAVDEEFVFVVTAVCGGDPRVRRFPKDGGPPEDSFDDERMQYSYAEYGYADDDATRLYWVSATDVMSLPKDFAPDAAPERIASRPPEPDAGTFQAVRVDDRIYALLHDRLVAIDKTSRTMVVLARDLAAQGGRAAIDVDATHVYFTQPKAGIVGRVPRAGGDVETIARGQSQPAGIVVDDTWVFWTNAGDGTVLRAAK